MSQERIFQLFYEVWLPWTAIAVIALLTAVGLLALLSQKWFTTVSKIAARWFDTNSWLRRGDRLIDVDEMVLKHSRLFGGVVLLWAGLIAFALPGITPLQPWAVYTVWAVWSVVAGLGVLALLAPPFFARLTRLANIWVDTSTFSDFLDRPYDIDRFAIRYRRALGVVLLMGASSVGYLSFV